MLALIIEDDASIRKTTSVVLRRLFPGINILTAESAEQAIALLQESACDGPAFDLVISDYNLRGARTGGDVLDWIQAHLSYLAQRFVFVASADEIFTRGVPFFEKPCDINELRNVLRSLVSNH